ncbi:MAG: hypothetical protein MZV65_18005 [Chromatiales bacterium]|nr:hypothetical protein [Chromatiales bacterium]
MKWLRQLYDGMMAGAQVYAQWDITTSKRILGDRRRMLILGLLMLPIAVVGVAFAADVGGALPTLLGGKSGLQPGLLHHDHLPGLDRHRRRWPA